MELSKPFTEKELISLIDNIADSSGYNSTNEMLQDWAREQIEDERGWFVFTRISSIIFLLDYIPWEIED